jgi:hypothetical protein
VSCLWESALQRGGLFMEEQETSYYLRQFVNAIAYCHKHRVVHRCVPSRDCGFRCISHRCACKLRDLLCNECGVVARKMLSISQQLHKQPIHSQHCSCPMLEKPVYFSKHA